MTSPLITGPGVGSADQGVNGSAPGIGKLLQLRDLPPASARELVANGGGREIQHLRDLGNRVLANRSASFCSVLDHVDQYRTSATKSPELY